MATNYAPPRYAGETCGVKSTKGGAGPKFSQKKLRQCVEDANAYDSKFNLRSNSDLHNVVNQIMRNMEIEKERKRVLVAERNYKKMNLELQRRKGRVFTEDVEERFIPSIRHRGRCSDKELEYELSRAQLCVAKAKARASKKMRKHNNRIDFIPTECVPNVEFQAGIADISFDEIKWFLDAVMTGISEYVGSLDLTALAALLQFVVVVTRTKDTLIRTISCANLCIALKIDLKTTFAVGLISTFASMAVGKIFEDTKEDIQFQSMESFRSTLDKVLHSDLTHAIRMVCIGMTSFLNFPTEITSQIFALIGSSPLKMSILKLIENMLSIITKIYSASALYWYGKDGQAVPISEILFGATIYDGLREQYAILDMYKESTYGGLPVNGYMCQYYYMRQSSVFLNTARAYLESAGRHNPNYKVIQSWTLDVTKWSNDVSNYIAGTNRVPAFAFVLCGAPGVGKSNTMKLLLSRPAAIKGYRYDESQVYSRNPSEEFWEGYKCKEHNCVFISEVAKGHEDLVKKTGDIGMDAILSCVDSNRFNVPMAFGEKGKVPFLAELMGLDTNNPGLNLGVLYSNPAAFARRFLFINQWVDPEFCIPGSSQIDSNKCLALDNPFVPYRYEVYILIPVNAKKSDKIIIAGNIDWIELVERFDKAFIMHQAQNSQVNVKVLDFIRKIPSSQTPNYVKPPPTEQERELGIEEIDEKAIEEAKEHCVQERFSPPTSVDEKHLRQGIHLGPIPQPKGKTGQQQFAELKEQLAENIAKRFPKVLAPIAVSLLPSFLSDGGINVEQKDPGRYVESVLVNAAMGDDMRSFLIARGDIDLLFEYDVFVGSIKTHAELDSMLLSDRDHKAYLLLFDTFAKCDDPETFRDELTIVFKRASEVCRHFVLTHVQANSFMSYVEGRLARYRDLCFRYTAQFVLPVEIDEKDLQFGIEEITEGIERVHTFVLNHLIAMSNFIFVYSQYNIIMLMFYLYSIHINPYLYLVTFIMAYFGLLSPIFFIVLVLHKLFVLSFPRFIRVRALRLIQSRIASARYMILDVYDSFLARFGFRQRNPNLANGWFYGYASMTLLGVVVVGASVKLVNVVSDMFRKSPVFNNGFSKFARFEEETHCSSPVRRVKLKHDPYNWNIVAPTNPRYLYTQSISDFSNFILQRTFFVWFEKEVNGEIVRVVSHCVGLCKNIVMLNTHFHAEAVKLHSRIWASDVDNEWRKDFEVSIDVGSFVSDDQDITLSTTGRSFKDLVQHFSLKPITDGMAMIGGKDVVASYHPDAQSIGNVILDGYYEYPGYSAKGYCGNLLIASIGKTCAILGFHIAGTPDLKRGFSRSIRRQDLTVLVNKLTNSINTFVPLSQPQCGIKNSTDDVKVNRKSPFAHIHLPSIEYHGTIENASSVNKRSTVERNIFSNIKEELVNITGISCTKEFGPPVMKPFEKDGVYLSPQNNGLKFFTRPSVMKHTALFSRTKDMLVKEISQRLKREGKFLPIKPYKMVYAINGSRCDEYFKRINASTAAGYPLTGKKSDYLILQDDGYTRIPNDKLVEEIEKILESYNAGERSNSVFNVALKDEPVSVKKIKEASTRFFYVHPLGHLVLCRMFLGPFVTLMQESDAFGCMVGINMYDNADKVYSKMIKFPNYLEADAKKFDISVAYVARSATYQLVMEILELLGYEENELKIVRGLLSDLLNPLYILDGDLFSKSSVPSGHYATAELNCLIILIIMAAVFLEAKERGDIPMDANFFDEIDPAYYGDDQSASVSDVVAQYVNNVTISEKYSEINMELTASDKCSYLTPFVEVKDATFLKRSFVNLGDRVIAPLDPQSVYKMSSWSLAPQSCTYIERDSSVINSALLEWFLIIQTGPNPIATYNRIRDCYNKCFHDEYGIYPRNAFSYEYVCELLGWKKIQFQSGGIVVDKRKHFEPKINFLMVMFLLFVYFLNLCPYNIIVWEEDSTGRSIYSNSSTDQIGWSERAFSEDTCRSHPGVYKKLDVDPFVLVLANQHLLIGLAQEYKIRKYKLQEQLEVAEKELSGLQPPHVGMFPMTVKHTTRYAGDPVFREYCDAWLEKCSLVENLRSEINLLSNIVRSVEVFSMEFQSAEVGAQKSGTIDDSVVVKHDTLTEIGGMETKEIGIEHTNMKFIRAPGSMDDFFKRPLEIGSFAIAPGGTYEYAYNVMDLYLSDPAVRAKLRNFAFLRGKITLRIAASGTPFDSGRLMIAAYPWYETNATLGALFTIGATWDIMKLQYMSQSKISTVLDLKENKPIDMTMPWVSPMPVGRLFNSSTSAIATTDSFNDFRNMWRVYIKTLNPLASVASTPSNVYVYLYAFMEDVELGVPTASQMAITTQSDERIVGPVERISSNLYSISSSLEQAPYISIYAKASSFVLKGISGIASLFGWSAPVLNVKPGRVKNEPYQNGTTTIQYDTGKRIVLDPKQELAISTEYVSVDKDELIIADICARMAYLTTFTWEAATASKSNFYFIAMHPRLSEGYTGPTSNIQNVLPTPMEFMSLMFAKWHGKIVITLEAVCTAFHRGKLLITYDPNVMQYLNISTNTNLNKQYTHVWDIQETQKYSICVEWNFPRPWAENLSNTNSYNTLHGPSLSPTAAWFNAVNGFLAIAPLTKLQSPDGSDISINIYVHGEDMKFNRFQQALIPRNRAINFQSGEHKVENIDSSCISINRPEMDGVGMEHHYYGEQPISLRSLFKRFTETRYSTFTCGTNLAYVYSGTMYPTNPYPVGTNGSTATVGWNAFNHVRQAFLAMRGSMRHRLMIMTDAPLNIAPTFTCLRQDETSTSIGANSGAITGTNAFTAGGIVNILDTNGGIEFEVPFYSNNLFVWSSSSDPYLSTATLPFDPSLLRGFDTEFYPSGTPTLFGVRDHSATGEDFQMSYFLGAVPYVCS